MGGQGSGRKPTEGTKVADGKRICVYFNQQELRAIRHAAVDQDMSVTKWLAKVARQAIEGGSYGTK